MRVFIVKMDWATEDDAKVDLFVYKHYTDAYDKFKELVCEERNPEISWVGDLDFDDNGYPVDEKYECYFEDNNSCESEVYWYITDNEERRHTYIDLLVKEVM